MQKVRTAANAAKCRNNLHNLGLALHEYHNIVGNFPPSYQALGNDPSLIKPGIGWGWFILPFIEQKQLDHALRNENDGFQTLISYWVSPTNYTQTPLALFRCPNDNGPSTNPNHGFHATSNYRATEYDAQSDLIGLGFDAGGVLYRNSAVRVTDIGVGTSNVAMVGECSLDANHWAAIWPGMVGTVFNNGYIVTNISSVEWDEFAVGSKLNGAAPQAFGSNHNGVNFLFADGSVQVFHDGDTVPMSRN